ncbi:MAG: hypothetical protein ACR2NP_01490 [Pirellulaceae bacterium]
MKRFVNRPGMVLFSLMIAGYLNCQTQESAANEINSGIAWYGVLSDGLAEAERTGKPILLVSAAPQCIGVSGMW